MLRNRILFTSGALVPWVLLLLALLPLPTESKAKCPKGSAVVRVENTVTCRCTTSGAHWIKGKCRKANLPHSDWLDEHNAARAVHGLTSLTWDGRVAFRALSWADRLTETECKPKSDPRGWIDMGNNCFKFYRIGWNITGLPREAVGAWVAEGSYYKRNKYPKGCDKGVDCKHYTQVVWRDTKEVGCGIAHCKGGNGIICCKYVPEGNIEGQEPY